MMRLILTSAFAALLAAGMGVGVQAMSHGDGGDKAAHRKAFNAALDACEEKTHDERSDCYAEAMREYQEKRMKEGMKK